MTEHKKRRERRRYGDGEEMKLRNEKEGEAGVKLERILGN
jgi:hypothetical protein